jgi:enterobacterial common antigen flippase
LLIAVPGVLATITLAPLVLTIFYSQAFVDAAGIIRWQIIGIALRVVSWPLGFVQLAKGRAKLFAITEFATSALHVALLVVALKFFGLEGIGISFAVLYGCYTLGMLSVCRGLSGFRWTPTTQKLLLGCCVIVALASGAVRYLPPMSAIATGLVLTAITAVAALHRLEHLLGFKFWTVLKAKLALR